MKARTLLRHPREAKPIEEYRQFMDEEGLQEIKRMASLLLGVKLTHINSTRLGGGVAEHLSSLVKLTRGLNLQVRWKTLQAPGEFFEVTKAFHNALQGAPLRFGESMAETYLKYNRLNAELVTPEADIVIVHDPQPLPLVEFRGQSQRWVWWCHVEPTYAEPRLWNFLLNYILKYDAFIFSQEAYVKPELKGRQVFILPPAIDPLAPKNVTLTQAQVAQTLEKFNIDPDAPLLCQVSRFDPWKDPLGAIDLYRHVKRKVPNVQLALAGSLVDDDPEGQEWLRKTVNHAVGDRDIHVLTNLSDMEINALQSGASVVIQNSVREGFGLTVTEALWKRKPVVARRAGGISLQVIDGVTGFLCDTLEQMSEKAVWLLLNPETARRLGEAGHEHVKKNFLVTRHLHEHLKLLVQLAGRVKPTIGPVRR